MTETTARGIVRQYSRNVLCLPTLRTTRNHADEVEYDELQRPFNVTQSATDGQKYGDADAKFGKSRFAMPSPEQRQFEYDALDRVTTVIFADSSQMSVEYDNEFNVKAVVDNHGNRTEYGYYGDNRLHTVTIIRAEQDDRVFTYTYDEAGRPKQIEYPAPTGVIAYFGEIVEESWVSGFDDDGQLKKLRYMRTVEETEVRLLELQYDYDDSGNRTQMIEIAANDDQVTWDYSYDWLDRLVGVTKDTGGGPVTVATYEYDESDNVLTRDELAGTTTFEYDDANQLSLRKVDASTVESFVHDDDGNMVSRTLTAGSVTTTYDFDDLDRIVRFGLPGGVEHNAYDSGNVRKSSTAVNGATTDFTYGGALAPMNETTPGPVQTATILADQMRGFERGGDFFYAVTDALGSVRLMVDEDGETVYSNSIGAWGDILSVDNDVPGGMPYDFVGAFGVRRDADSGLLYMQQRWYDAGLQRFVSRDPMVTARNQFAYGSNNPIRFIDPLGLAPTLEQEFNNALDFIRAVDAKGYSVVLNQLKWLYDSGRVIEDNGIAALAMMDRVGDLFVRSRKLRVNTNSLLAVGPIGKNKFIKMCDPKGSGVDYYVFAGVLIHEETHYMYGNNEITAWTAELQFYKNAYYQAVANHQSARAIYLWQLGQLREAEGRMNNELPGTIPWMFPPDKTPGQ